MAGRKGKSDGAFEIVLADVRVWASYFYRLEVDGGVGQRCPFLYDWQEVFLGWD
jgi:hypothetical protein